METNKFELRWENFWQTLNVENDFQAIYGYRMLRILYSFPARSYHSLENHIQHCLTEFDAVKHLANDPKALEFAIWFHDCIYDTKLQGIEERSADMATMLIRMAQLPHHLRAKVVDLILATRHIDIPTTNDVQLICDIDLSPLGLPWEQFDQNTKYIREEYAHVPLPQFAEGRLRILQAKLDQKHIYRTSYFRDKYEAQAVENLTRYCHELTLIPFG